MEKSTRTETGQMCYRRIRQLAMYGQLTVGERLGEVEWSQRLGAHRSAVREALVLLAHEGLLIRGERGGFFVPQFLTEDVIDIAESRLVVEQGALRLLAKQQVSPERFKPLRDLCENMQLLIDADLRLGYVEADRKFHEALVELSGSKRLAIMYRQAPLPQLLPNHSVLDIDQEVYLTSHKQHCQILELLTEQQYQQAIALLEKHLMSPLLASLSLPEGRNSLA